MLHVYVLLSGVTSSRVVVPCGIRLCAAVLARVSGDVGSEFNCWLSASWCRALNACLSRCSDSLRPEADSTTHAYVSRIQAAVSL